MDNPDPISENLEQPENLPSTIKFGPKGISIQDIIDYRQRGLSTKQIGKLIGCSGANVSKRLAKISDSLDNTHKYRKNKALTFAWLQNRIIQNVTDADIVKAKLIDKVKAVSFLNNAERLEEGKSTQNIAYADMVKMLHRTNREIEDIETSFDLQPIEMTSDTEQNT